MPHHNGRMERFQETLRRLRERYALFPTSVVELYDSIATETFDKRSLYLNQGYWREATTIDGACRDMAKLVAEQAQLTAQDVVLDAGFGFAEQDMYWMEFFQPKGIVGVNITASQVALARQRVADRQMDSRIELMVGSATELPVLAESFSKVIALESAFHFNTREQFFQEAYRILRPGGRLVLADVIAIPDPSRWVQRRLVWWSWLLFHLMWAVPRENMYGRDTYVRKLTSLGFENIRVESIWKYVYPPFHRYCATHPPFLRNFRPLARFMYTLSLRMDAEAVYGAYDYVIVTADKQTSGTK